MSGGSMRRVAQTIGPAVSQASGAARRAPSPAAAIVPAGASSALARASSSGHISSSNGVQDLRVVFGPVPTQEEAREATLDLRHALERTQSNLSTVGHATFQALQLIRRPEVQHIITSAAANIRVWDAIFGDEAVADFFRNHMAVECIQAEPYWERMETAMLETSGFINWVLKMIQSLAEMLSNTVDFLHSIQASLEEGFGLNTDPDFGTANTDATQLPVSSSIFLLIITTIMVVLVRRRLG